MDSIKEEGLCTGLRHLSLVFLFSRCPPPPPVPASVGAIMDFSCVQTLRPAPPPRFSINNRAPALCPGCLERLPLSCHLSAVSAVSGVSAPLCARSRHRYRHLFGFLCCWCRQTPQPPHFQEPTLPTVHQWQIFAGFHTITHPTFVQLGLFNL